MGALQARLGHLLEAEATALAGLARDPLRPRLYVVLSEARRARGDLEGARRAAEEGIARLAGDASLGVEHGTVLSLLGDFAGAERAFLSVLSREPLYPAAYMSLAALASKRGGDATMAHTLGTGRWRPPTRTPRSSDARFAWGSASESEGVARASRIATLARALLARTPEDAGAPLALAQSPAQTGEVRKPSRATRASSRWRRARRSQNARRGFPGERGRWPRAGVDCSAASSRGPRRVR